MQSRVWLLFSLCNLLWCAHPADAQKLSFAPSAGIWLPGPKTFDNNHKAGWTLSGQAGYRFLENEYVNLDGIADLRFVFSRLEDRLAEEQGNLLNISIGIRAESPAINPANGHVYLSIKLGPTVEFAEGEPGHGPPKGDIYSALSLAYLRPVSSKLAWGAFLEVSYGESDDASNIAWIIPGLFLQFGKQ